MKEPMSFEKFKAIMNTIVTFNEKQDKFSKFIEEEIATSTFCVVDFGSEVESALINLLADEFNCWYSFKDRDYDWWNDSFGIENGGAVLSIDKKTNLIILSFTFIVSTFSFELFKIVLLNFVTMAENNMAKYEKLLNQS